MADPPGFFGKVLPGATYLLVDDVVTSGGSLLQLAAHIQSHGGTVAGAITLATVKGGPEAAGQRRYHRSGEEEAWAVGSRVSWSLRVRI